MHKWSHAKLEQKILDGIYCSNSIYKLLNIVGSFIHEGLKACTKTMHVKASFPAILSLDTTCSFFLQGLLNQVSNFCDPSHGGFFVKKIFSILSHFLSPEKLTHKKAEQFGQINT